MVVEEAHPFYWFIIIAVLNCRTFRSGSSFFGGIARRCQNI